MCILYGFLIPGCMIAFFASLVEYMDTKFIHPGLMMIAVLVASLGIFFAGCFNYHSDEFERYGKL